MKISNRTHPVLELINSGRLRSDDSEKNKEWAALSEKFKSNIQLITKPFAEAIFAAYSKMMASDLAKEAMSTNTAGCFLWQHVTMCYDITVNDTGSEITYFQIANINNQLGMTAYFKAHVEKGTSQVTFATHEIIDSTKLQMLAVHLICVINFIRYAEVQTVHLHPKAKSKDIVCKYVNDTNSSIKILDSKWFTNLVKSDGFKVRGHFRLQPKKKDGEWTKELIWINDFQKSGYTAPAKILNTPVN